MSLQSKVEEKTTIITTNQNSTDTNFKEGDASSLDDFDLEHGICDAVTPRETNLCGHYKQSFAYYTFRQRLPTTLNTLLNRLKDELNGSNYIELDINTVLASIEKLKQQLETNGQLEKFTGNESDKAIWNQFINNLPKDQANFYNTCWLYAECYLYRKIYSFFEVSHSLKDYDYFGAQKVNALKISADAMDKLLQNTHTTEKTLQMFTRMLKLNLWGNRCDLSLSSGQEVRPSGNLFELIDGLNANILIDDSAHIWHCLADGSIRHNSNKSIDLVCDNAGFELFTDLLLAQYLIEHKLADVVRFHVKAMPWYVSDTTAHDIHYTLQYLQEHKSENLNSFGQKCSKYFDENLFQIVDKESFWTTPYEFFRMIDLNPALYKQLQESLLIIFKGDLNYRKLLGDFNWDFTENFQKCLRGFLPANLCTLRTVKGDLMCGLQPGAADKLNSIDSDWMFTGEYGIIQFAGKC